MIWKQDILEVASMVVTRWIVAFLRSASYCNAGMVTTTMWYQIIRFILLGNYNTQTANNIIQALVAENRAV